MLRSAPTYGLWVRPFSRRADPDRWGPAGDAVRLSAPLGVRRVCRHPWHGLRSVRCKTIRAMVRAKKGS